MIDDKIRAGAEILNMAGANIDSKAYDNAIASKDPQSSLRMMFLASLGVKSHAHAVHQLWLVLRLKLNSADPLMRAQGQMLVDVLCDHDLLTPADRLAVVPYIKKEILSGALESEGIISLFERAFPLDYDVQTTTLLWKKVVANGTGEEAERLLGRADPSKTEPFVIARSASQLAPTELYVRSLNDEALKRALEGLGNVASASVSSGEGVWRRAECAPLMTVLVSEHVRRHGVSDGVAAQFFRDFINDHYRLNDRINPFMPHLLSVAQALGRLDDERLFRYLFEGAVNHVPLEALEGFIEAGMPVSRTVETPRGDHPVHYLIDDAFLDRVGLMARAMDQGQRDAYLQESFARRADDLSALWANRKSVMDSNFVTVLHDAGFDVGRQRLDPSGKKLLWPHETGLPIGGRTGNRAVFTLMHALGVYPQDLRMDGLSPLHAAAYYNDVKALRALVERGYDINEPAGADAVPFEYGEKIKPAGNVPLVIALSRKNREAVEALIEAGADLGVKASTGASLMQLAKDDEFKRLIRAARTGAAVTKAMGDPDMEFKPSASHSVSGVL